MDQSANRIFSLKPDPGGTRECVGYERRVANLDELDRDLAVGEPVALRTSKLRGQARLSGASRPQHGQKTGVSQQAAQLTHFLPASDEAGKPQWDNGGSAHHLNSGPEVVFRRLRTVITLWPACPESSQKSQTVEGLDHIGSRRKQPSSKSVH
jgi:hypothetical protein